MESRILGKHVSDGNRILYPLLVMAAIAVIIFSAFGVATMTGLLPSAESMNASHARTQSAIPTLPATPAQTGSQFQLQAESEDRNAGKPGVICGNCGVIESITPVEVRNSGSGLGMVAGGVAGALLGNQIGRGNGNAIATIAGAAGGAYAGNEIEKNTKKSLRYQVRVRMDDGTSRSVSLSHPPAFAAGDKVRVVNGQVVAAG
jgi:outer membrane lipoprotein SlyB